jgi:hypothetical protein
MSNEILSFTIKMERKQWERKEKETPKQQSFCRERLK